MISSLVKVRQRNIEEIKRYLPDHDITDEYSYQFKFSWNYLGKRVVENADRIAREFK